MNYPPELQELRDLSQRHSDLAAAYAEADPDDDADRIYNRLRSLEQAITTEVADLFYELEHPMPRLRLLMSRPSPFKEESK